MKAGSGDTESGGDIRLCATVDGRSLEMLCVLDRDGILCGGEATPDGGRDKAESNEEAMGGGGQTGPGARCCTVSNPRDYGTLLLVRLQGVNQFVQLRGCGRAAAAPRIQVLVRSGVHSVSNTGGRLVGRCVGCGVVPLLLVVNCVFCVLYSVAPIDGPGGTRGKTDWAKVLDRNREGCEPGDSVSISQGCNGRLDATLLADLVRFAGRPNCGRRN